MLTLPRMRPAGLKFELLVWAAYLLAALLYSWPLALNLLEAVPGEDRGDAWQMVWNLWWVRYALEHGRNPFETDLIFYPQGTGLWLHALNALNGLLSLPAQYLGHLAGGAAGGAVAGYNFVVLFSLSTSAWGAFALARYLWRDWRAALVAGLGFGFCAYHAAHLLGHLNLVSSEFIPIYILLFLKALHSPGRPLKIALAAALALLALTLLELQYVLYMALFSGLYLLYITMIAARERRRRNRLPVTDGVAGYAAGKMFRRAGLVAGLYGLLSLPLTVPMLREALTNPNTVPARQERIYSADLLAYFYPSPFHPLWGDFMAGAVRPFTATLIEKIVFPGFTLYLLALAGAFVKAKSSKFSRESRIPSPESHIQSWEEKGEGAGVFRPGAGWWALVAGVFGLLSFGPRLHVNGVEWGPPLPGALIYELPLLNITRVPSRFAIVAVLALALLAAWGLVRLRGGLQLRPAAYNGLAGLSLLALGFELLAAPYPLARYQAPAFYRELAGQPGRDYSVMELPLNFGRYQYETAYLKAQLEHRKPLLNGYISRNPQFPPYYGLPVFREFRDLATEPRPDILPPFPFGPEVLRNWRVRYIVVRKDIIAGGERARAFELVNRLLPGVRPVHDSPELAAYEIPPGPAAEFIYNLVLPGWYEAEVGPDGAAGRWARGSQAGFDFWTAGPRRLELEMPLWSYLTPHPVEFVLNGRTVLQVEAGLEPQTVRLPLDLQPGPNRLTLRIKGQANRPSDNGSPADSRPLTVGVGPVKFV